jgi:hypothetical protein
MVYSISLGKPLRKHGFAWWRFGQMELGTKSTPYPQSYGSDYPEPSTQVDIVLVGSHTKAVILLLFYMLADRKPVQDLRQVVKVVIKFMYSTNKAS